MVKDQAVEQHAPECQGQVLTGPACRALDLSLQCGPHTGGAIVRPATARWAQGNAHQHVQSLSRSPGGPHGARVPQALLM